MTTASAPMLAGSSRSLGIPITSSTSSYFPRCAGVWCGASAATFSEYSTSLFALCAASATSAALASHCTSRWWRVARPRFPSFSYASFSPPSLSLATFTLSASPFHSFHAPHLPSPSSLIFALLLTASGTGPLLHALRRQRDNPGRRASIHVYKSSIVCYSVRKFLSDKICVYRSGDQRIGGSGRQHCKEDWW